MKLVAAFLFLNLSSIAVACPVFMGRFSCVDNADGKLVKKIALLGGDDNEKTYLVDGVFNDLDVNSFKANGAIETTYLNNGARTNSLAACHDSVLEINVHQYFGARDANEFYHYRSARIETKADGQIAMILVDVSTGEMIRSEFMCTNFP